MEIFRIDWITLLGLVAATLSTLAGLPQLVKSWRTKSTGDLSLLFLLMGTSGCVLWLLYGLLISSLPLIAANSIGLSVLGTILYLKLRYK